MVKIAKANAMNTLHFDIDSRIKREGSGCVCSFLYFIKQKSRLIMLVELQAVSDVMTNLV